MVESAFRILAVLAAPAPLMLATDSDDTLTQPAVGFTASVPSFAAAFGLSALAGLIARRPKPAFAES